METGGGGGGGGGGEASASTGCSQAAEGAGCRKSIYPQLSLLSTHVLCLLSYHEGEEHQATDARGELAQQLACLSGPGRHPKEGQDVTTQRALADNEVNER